MDVDWLKLLVNKSRKGTGLTIPFMVGALALNNESNKLTIGELLSIIVKNDKSEVMLRFCNEIREFILTVSSNFILGKSYIKHLEFGNLLVVPERNLKGLDELEHIIISLEIDYDKYINASNYSKRNEDWFGFDQDDQNFIIDSLKVQLNDG